MSAIYGGQANKKANRNLFYLVQHLEATDDVLVTPVQITVLDGEGCVLETGQAVRVEGDWWESASPAHGKTVIAEAWDLPGNVTKLVLYPHPASPKYDTKI
jgi:hypothetical protein